ncbi:MAG TPA: BON domain-containing protein [Candidatus Angelobacter sp.]
MFEFSNLISFILACTIAAAAEITGTAQGQAQAQAQVSATPTQTDARPVRAGQSASGNSSQETKPAKPTATDEAEAPGLLQLPEAVPEDGNPMKDAELQSSIQNALNRDPALGHAGLHVAVAGDRIELSGNVARSREKQSAGRIVQSFAGSRKVLNQIAIGGGAVVAPATHSPENGASHTSKPENRGLVAPSPSPDKAPPPPLL